MSCMYSCCVVVMTSGLQFRFDCITCMGPVSIFFGLSGIVFYFFLVLAAVCVVVLRRGFHIALLLWTLRQFREVAACPLRPPDGGPRCVGPASLSKPLRLSHTGNPGSFAAWFPLQLAYFRSLYGHLTSFPHSLHTCFGWSAEVWSVLVQCIHLGLRLQLRVRCVRSRQLRHLLILFVST